jgi:hypothetical protein
MSSRAGRLAALAVAGGLAMPLLAGGCSVSVGPLQHRTSSYSVAGPLQSLVVHAHVGNVHVTGEAPGSKVTVTEQLTFRKTAPVTTHRTAARVLALSSTYPSLLRVPGNVGYAVDASTTVGATRIGVQRSAASPHVITARATTGSIRIEPAR